MIVTETIKYYFIAYLLVTVFASLHFLFNWKVRKQQAFDPTMGLRALRENATTFEAFKTTKPFHPLYNLIIFPLVGVMMMNQWTIIPTLTQAMGIGGLWLIYSVLFDLICWVIIPHPWRLSLKGLFITYQPWISFAYLAIAISPMISILYFFLFS